MIIVEISYGLGNQMFQYALGRCLANKHNTELKLNVSYYDDKKETHHNHYKLNAFKIKENFATYEEIQNCSVWSGAELRSDYGGFSQKFFDCPDNTFIKGLMMSEKYFKEIEDIVRREFTLKNPLGTISSEWKEKILSANCAVCVHVRHGDYLMPMNIGHGILPVNYYLRALNQLKKEFNNIKVFIFSDDLQWCKKNLKFDVPTEFVEGCERDTEEMYLMSLCKHNIIANSTFAWWGAWLNQNPDKKVFAPYPWVRSLYWRNIIPDNWIKIPIDYSASTPKNLSLIVYVNENVDTLALSLASLLMQRRREYEIILLDASTDGSSKVCRQFAADEKVNILRIDSSTDKFSAWNKGLDIACGDYVLFLTGKNFIFPQMANMVANICDADFKKYANSPKTYMTYNTYTNYIPNIICSTKSFEENENGDIGINGIPNKKFSVQVDEPFKNLNTFVETDFSSQEKLLMLGTKQINSNVDTKFFKRKFLIDNNIQFREGGGTDAELLFLVNAFLATEKITFTPQPFLGRLK